jgi:hypothetical protein
LEDGWKATGKVREIFYERITKIPSTTELEFVCERTRGNTKSNKQGGKIARKCDLILAKIVENGLDKSTTRCIKATKFTKVKKKKILSKIKQRME